MLGLRHVWARGYGLAVLTVGIAYGFTSRFSHQTAETISPLFLIAVMVTVWYGGLGPGMLATALGTVAAAFIYLPPHYRLEIGMDDLLRLLMFVTVAVLVNYRNERTRRAHKAVQEAWQAAEEASRAKDSFLAMVSHELRNPLAAVTSAVDAIERQGRLPAADEELERIRRNVNLEIRLIEDLLDVTRITRGKLQMKAETVDAEQVIRHALEVCQGEIAAKRIQVSVDSRALQRHVNGDPARLQQVFWNVLRNAVKFTPEGGRISIRTWNEESAPQDGEDRPTPQLLVAISDTGIGIEPEVLPRIFDAFEQGRAGFAQRYGGLGLGLAIARALAEVHGGTLTAASEGPGKGATFTVALPTTTAPAAVRQRTVLPIEPAAKGLSILLVEDHEDAAYAMTRLLQAEGHRVASASSVRAAMSLASAGEFDLVISDLGLPDGSGLDLMRTLQRQHVKGIAISGRGSEQDLRESREAGFQEHLVKPVSLQQLMGAISHVSGSD